MSTFCHKRPEDLSFLHHGKKVQQPSIAIGLVVVHLPGHVEEFRSTGPSSVQEYPVIHAVLRRPELLLCSASCSIRPGSCLRPGLQEQFFQV